MINKKIKNDIHKIKKYKKITINDLFVNLHQFINNPLYLEGL